jgi:hypothetical protein
MSSLQNGLKYAQFPGVCIINSGSNKICARLYTQLHSNISVESYALLLFRLKLLYCPFFCSICIILWHVDLLLGNDRETSSYTIAVFK